MARRFQSSPLNILYEDDQIIVCVKPHGIATQSRSVAVPDMERLIKNHLCRSAPGNAASAGKEPYLAVIHRLDQPVTGILVFAKTKSAARELSRQLTDPKKAAFGKYYRALVEKRPDTDSGILEDYLCKDPRTNTSRVCSKNTPGARLARLEFHIAVDNFFHWGRGISKNPPSPMAPTELLIHIFTGRHHQIRVQLANMGCPILGDTKYNPHSMWNVGKNSWQQIYLCAYKLTFRHPTTGKPMTFELKDARDCGF